MNSINYMNLPSYLGNSNFLVNINELTGINSSASGLSATSALQTAVTNIQKMVDYDKKQINVNYISNYDTSPIQVLSPLNLSNVNLYQNGNIFVGGSGGTYLSSGTTSIILNSTSSPTTIAMNFLAANSTIMTLNQQGTLSLPYGALPNTFLECIDLSGTAQWNYVSSITNSIASFNTTSSNSFSFQQSGSEVASVDSYGRVTAQDFLSLSDRRYKDHISTLTDAGSLIKGLRGVRFDWKKDGSHDVGVIAQEVFAHIPEAIVSTGTNMLNVAYNKIIPYLIETIKDLQLRVEALEKNDLQLRVEALEAKQR
jgi:hypothetical protein